MIQDDARLSKAVLALAPQHAADWDDVVDRSQAMLRARGRRRRFALALAVATLVIGAGTAWAVGSQVFGWFSVSRAPLEAPSLPAASGYVVGRELHPAKGKAQRLSRPLFAPLLGEDATLVVPSPNGAHLVYHAWRPAGSTTGTPILVLHDTATGADRLLARGAQTVAWSRNGRIAYFQADRPRYEQRDGAYTGNVVVRTLHGQARTWTRRSGDFEVLAWAGRTLLVQVRPCVFANCRRDPAAGVYALSSDGALRPLHLATLAALSPNGRYAFGRYDSVPGQDTPSTLVRLTRVRDGRPLATLDLLRPLKRAGLPGSLFGASWRKDEIAASFSGSALVVFRVRRGRPVLEQILRIPARTLRTRYPATLGIPLLTGPKNGNVIVTVRGATLGDRSLVAVLACSRATRHCVRGKVLPIRHWFAIADNPSRPWIARR